MSINHLVLDLNFLRHPVRGRDFSTVSVVQNGRCLKQNFRYVYFVVKEDPYFALGEKKAIVTKFRSNVEIIVT